MDRVQLAILNMFLTIPIVGLWLGVCYGLIPKKHEHTANVGIVLIVGIMGFVLSYLVVTDPRCANFFI